MSTAAAATSPSSTSAAFFLLSDASSASSAGFRTRRLLCHRSARMPRSTAWRVKTCFAVVAKHVFKRQAVLRGIRALQGHSSRPVRKPEEEAEDASDNKKKAAEVELGEGAAAAVEHHVGN